RELPAGRLDQKLGPAPVEHPGTEDDLAGVAQSAHEQVVAGRNGHSAGRVAALNDLLAFVERGGSVGARRRRQKRQTRGERQQKRGAAVVTDILDDTASHLNLLLTAGEEEPMLARERAGELLSVGPGSFPLRRGEYSARRDFPDVR